MGSPEEALENHQNLFIIESPQNLAARLSLTFSDWLILSRALTHRSYLNEHPDALEDNERLEFLGDAILDFIVGAWLYNRYPEMQEGELTRLRSALVHTEQLAEFARDLQIGQALKLGRGELQAGGRERSALLCDVFEAVIGAIYLDQGLEAVETFLSPLLNLAVDDILLNHKDEDPKSQLQEWAQAQGFSAPTYITRNISGPDHSRIFEVDVQVGKTILASGSGRSKQAATKDAAKKALGVLAKSSASHSTNPLS